MRRASRQAERKQKPVSHSLFVSSTNAVYCTRYVSKVATCKSKSIRQVPNWARNLDKTKCVCLHEIYIDSTDTGSVLLALKHGMKGHLGRQSDLSKNEGILQRVARTNSEDGKFNSVATSVFSCLLGPSQ